MPFDVGFSNTMEGEDAAQPVALVVNFGSACFLISSGKLKFEGAAAGLQFSIRLSCSAGHYLF